MAVAALERLRDDLVRLQHRSGGVREFSLGAARILARAVGFDGVCVVTLDPATLLPTGEVVENGLPPAAYARMAEIEVRDDDVNAFRDLARAPRPAASLSGATGGDLDRSRRHREVRRDEGLGDELRVALVGETATWGALTLLRGADGPGFAPAEVELVGALSRALAEGVRRALLLDALPAPGAEDEADAGLLLLAPDGTVAAADAAARRRLAELEPTGPSAPLPPVVRAVAARARDVADGVAAGPAVARARVRTPAGVWLVVRGSVLGGHGEARTAVTIERARAHDLAPLIAEAHGLTARERAIAQLVAQGLATDAIGARLHISPWTVQDHLKSIFAKVGVGTRGELVARLFFDHYAPRLAAGAPLAADGWFAAG